MLINGTNGNDKFPNELEGTNAADRIFGFAGMDDLYGMGGDDLLVGGKGADELFGGDGFDTASYATSAAAVTVHLDGSVGGSGGNAQGDNLYSMEGVIGSAKADYLYGDFGDNVLRGEAGGDFVSGEAGADELFGGKGADTLSGGSGRDELTGVQGGDRFVYAQATDSIAIVASRDLITDFSRQQGDEVDLQGVDANAVAAGDQAFSFVGGNGFTAAGQVRFAQVGGDTVVQASTDADASAEMEIVLDGGVALQASDFIL